MTYDLWRKIHLYSGFTLLSFVFMYFVTGYPLIHHGWFPESKPDTTEERAAVKAADIAADPAAYSDYLQDEFGLVGKVQPPQVWKDGRWRFAYTWYRLSKGWERTVGWALAGIGFAFTIGTILFLVHSG